MENTIVFALSSSKELAKEICDELGMSLGDIAIEHFADGEILVTPKDSVRGKHVYLVQSTNKPVNDNLMELLIAIDACKRASAQTINCIIPYFGYARQDRKAKPRQPITAKLVATLLESAGASRVATVDLHATQIQGFYDIPADDIAANSLIANYFLHKEASDLDKIVVVSPDHGGAVRARHLAEALHAPIAIIDKRRPKPNVAVAMNLIGDVNGKVAIIIDDMVDTAGTISSGVKMLKEHGATKVYATCSHGILSGPAIDRLKAAGLEEFVCTNTIDQTENLKKFPEMKVLSVAPLLAGLISSVETNSSLSAALKHAVHGYIAD
ncbi:ribose-phosphate diphosphokinase [Catenisphaera adipataccumulans]|jgi:ribose-phosphate pyrophosphokinase|uniref:Ribose-phosphate pyrophosphokinase n=1 Tax=Catenisphaera adipataccumulans TaxID=700500 RepID=A0A7W8CYM0_9FIRM|nr:ribose-phosphate pyrophosphokinase [Catenisphaera adipataccumulans]MBB5183359.1 ribose-phosphate pyrophosphokinase [Catenisphaera adipataccumulans]